MSDNIDRKLWDAAYAGDEALVSQLIDQATVDWRDDQYDWTALHMAAYGGHTPVVTRLLDAGWSLEARTDYGVIPLACAAQAGHLETVKCLLLRGANMDTQDDYKYTPLYYASTSGHSEVIKILLHCGANQQIRNRAGHTAEDVAKNEETRAVFSEFREKGLNTKEELFVKAVEEKNYDIAAVLAFNSEDTNVLKTIIEILDTKKIKDLTTLDYFHCSVSQNHLNILQYFNKNTSAYYGNNTLHHGALKESLTILKFSFKHSINIEKKNSEGNTPLHVAALSDNEKIVKCLIENGASSTQFMKNNDGQIPLELARHKKNIFKIILLDFLNYALKTPKLSSNEFQKQLGSGNTLFCLKRDLDGKTLFEFLNDQGMIKEREELIQLLIKIDHFRFQGTKERRGSKKRIIRILRAGMKPSRGLKESIDSAQEKYSWETGKIGVKCFISAIRNILLGWTLFGFDVGSDLNFYVGLGGENNSNTTINMNSAARTVTLVHMSLPLFSSS